MKLESAEFELCDVEDEFRIFLSNVEVKSQSKIWKDKNDIFPIFLEAFATSI